MKKNQLLVLLLCLSWTMNAQQRIEKPGFPSHGIPDQMKAIPFYNQACRAYAAGDTAGAIKELHKAINTSFALTEAQLFLADIYLQTKDYTKALLYYNSSIDFEVRQKQHYYFRLFELGMRHGMYDLVKHNLKHFKKIYGEAYRKQYEDDFPFGTVDFEYYKKCIDKVYDYKSWQADYCVKDTKCAHKVQNISSLNQKLVIVNHHLFAGKYKEKSAKIKAKKKLIQLPQGAKNPFITQDKQYVFFEMSRKNNSDLYYSKIKGKKCEKVVRMNDSINSVYYEGQAFFSKNGHYLYFISERTGNKDIYLAKFDPENNQTEFVKNLKKINSLRDEQFPVLSDDESVLYFSSNGLSGYGGFDLFQTTAYEKYGNLLIPLEPKNLSCGLNTENNELKIVQCGKDFFVLREDIYNTIKIIRAKKLPSKPKPDMNLKITSVKE